MTGAVPMTMPATGPTMTDRRLCWAALITARATVTGLTDGKSFKTSVDERSALPAPLKLVRTASGWIAATYTPVPLSSLDIARLKLVTNAFVAA